jgi:hypothetical protein
MKLYRWIINTDKDSGPTNYIVMANTRAEAVRSALARCPEHHSASITSIVPDVVFEGELIKI